MNISNLFYSNSAKPRTDGIYLCRHEGISVDGAPYKLSLFLVFNTFNRVLFDEEIGFPEIEKSSISTVVNNFRDHKEINPRCTIYEINAGKVKMKFKESSLYGDDYGTEYIGYIENGKLILDRISHFYDVRIHESNSRITLKSLKFEFLGL